jgi:RHS repeat-associated protein
VYQEAHDRRTEIRGRYIRKGRREFGFAVESYDRAQPLVIDPTIAWRQHIGGSGADMFTRVGVDAEGNIYAVGSTASPNFPTRGALSGALRGPADGVVLKLDPTGQTILYATFLGGSQTDTVRGIVIDSDGGLFLAGSTNSPDFPTQAALQATFGGGSEDAFVARLDPTGSSLTFSTFLGGSGQDRAVGLGRDAAGNLYTTGFTNSANFRTTAGVAQPASGGGFDAFVVKLSAAGDTMVYSTFLGGSTTDSATDIAVHPSGEVNLAGSTASANFPTTPGAYQRTYGGGTFDAFAARLSANGARLLYSTLIGGNASDLGRTVTFDALGFLWMGGQTESRNLPVTPNAVAPTFPGATFAGFYARLRIPEASSGAALTEDIPTPAVVTPEQTVTYRGRGGSVIKTLLWYLRNLFAPIPIFADSGGVLAAKIGCTPNTAGVAVEDDPSLCTALSEVFDVATTGRCISRAEDALVQRINGEGGPPQAVVGAGVTTVGDAAIVCVDLDEEARRDFFERLFDDLANSGDTNTDPVSTATGEMYHTRDLLNLGGPLELAFRFQYSSLLNRNGVASALGNNRMHNFEARMATLGSRATVMLFPGRAFNFIDSGSGFEPSDPEKRRHQLVRAGANFQFLELDESLIYTFSASGALLRIEDRNGNAFTVTQSAAGPTRVADNRGRTIDFTYTAGRLSRVQDQSGRRVEFTYTGDNLASFTDPEGKRYTYEHTSAGTRVGLLRGETAPVGNRPFTQTYDASGRVTEQSDGRGNRVRLAYDTPSAGVTTMTDPRGNAYQHTHQNGQNLTRIQDPAGQRIEVAYDGNNRRTSITDRDGARSAFTYDAAGNLASHTDAEGNTTGFAYAPQSQGPFTFFNLERINYPDGTSVTMTHDARGNVLTINDRAGKLWRFAYNSAGQPTSATNPAGGVTTLAYSEDGTLASARLPSGDVYRYAYDDKKRPIRVTNPDETTRAVAWDNRDLPVRLTDERAKATVIAYDDNGNVRTLTDAAGKSATLVYDPDERPTSLTDRNGKTSSLAYNETGDLVRVTNPAGDVLRLTRDNRNRISAAGDCTDKGPRFTRDGEGLLREATDELSRTARLERDRLGRVTRLTTPLAEAYQYAYDRMGRLTRSANPLGQATVYSYDPRGLLARIARPQEIAAGFERNDLGLISALTDPNGSVWRRAFDSQGRLTSQTDPLGRSTSLAYGPRSRLATITLPEGSANLTYDAAGNLVRRRYADGTDLTYTYDDNNRLTRANEITLEYDAEDRIIGSNGLRISRDDAGRIASITYADGRTVRYTRDCRGLLTGVTDWVGGTTTLAYDDARQLVSITRPNGVVTRFTYDNDGRVRSIAEGSISSIQLTRDGAGQITAADRNLPRLPDPAAATVEFSYDAAHQLAQGTSDGRGRRTSDANRAYNWDQASRLRSVTAGGRSHSFTYDGLDQRVSETREGVTESFVLNYALGLASVAVVRRGGADRRYYVHLPNGAPLHSIEADGTRRYFHFDEMGTTVFLSNDAGQVTDTYGVTPYGESVARTGQTENPFVYLGAFGVMQVGDTGLYHMRFRYFDSLTAQFLSRDPIQTLDPASPYRYARNNPLVYVDPTGLDDIPKEFIKFFLPLALTVLERERLRQVPGGAGDQPFLPEILAGLLARSPSGGSTAGIGAGAAIGPPVEVVPPKGKEPGNLAPAPPTPRPDTGLAVAEDWPVLEWHDWTPAPSPSSPQPRKRKPIWPKPRQRPIPTLAEELLAWLENYEEELADEDRGEPLGFPVAEAFLILFGVRNLPK